MLIRKSIHFAPEYRCKGKQKNGEKEIVRENLPLRMRVSYNNLRIEFVTGIRVDADKWDKANQRATGMNQAMQTASEINDYLDYLKAEIIKVFHKYEFMEEMPTREQLKTDFNERISQKDDENSSYADYDKQVTTVKKNVFWDAFREFIIIMEQISNELLEKTIGEMSGTEFLQLMKVANQATVEEKVEDDEDKYAYGIAGIAEIFHCSLPTANRIKKSGRIKKAITQIGRKIIVDKKLALELAGQPVYRRKGA